MARLARRWILVVCQVEAAMKWRCARACRGAALQATRERAGAACLRRVSSGRRPGLSVSPRPTIRGLDESPESSVDEHDRRAGSRPDPKRPGGRSPCRRARNLFVADVRRTPAASIRIVVRARNPKDSAGSYRQLSVCVYSLAAEME